MQINKNISELSDSLEIESIDRRNFIKLKLMVIIWMYFSQFFGINLLGKSTEKIDYSILDELLRLPFLDDEIKQEIELRVILQKKYCYDSNGNLHSLKRFFNEIGNFIISKKNISDFKLLDSLHYGEIDKVYYLNKAAQHDDVNTLKFIQTQLISYDNKILNEALLYAVKSRSTETTLELLSSKIKLDNKTKNTIQKLFYQEEYDQFYKQLAKTSGKLLLPSNKKYNLLNNKSKIQKHNINFDDVTSILEFENNLFTIAHNAMVDLYIQEIIDDFSVEKFKRKVTISIWNYKNSYPTDIFYKIDETLRINGFGELENMKSFWFDESEEQSYKNMKSFWFDKSGETSYENMTASEKLRECEFENNWVQKIDYNDLINIEIL